jgi:hypothetical protein
VKRALLLGAVVLCAAAPPAVAATRGSLPSPTVPVRFEPPLRTRTSPFAVTERRFPRRLDAHVAVRVGIDSTGRPVRVTATDRIVVLGAGDYSFAIPAPADEVAAGPGSASQPGLRSGTVLWQGFSAGRRVLVAQISLNAAAASKALPIRLVLRPGKVQIANATDTKVTLTTGRASPRAVAAALRTVYGAVRNRTPIAAPPIELSGATRTVKRVVRARVRVDGTYAFSDGEVGHVARELGDRPFRLSGSGELRRLELRVSVERPLAPLRRTATDVETASLRVFESALAAQYETYLANPDPSGQSATSYRFILAQRARPSETGGGGSGPWLEIGLAIGTLAALAGGVVLWAHM